MNPENKSPGEEYSKWEAPTTGERIEEYDEEGSSELSSEIPSQYRGLPSSVVEQLWQPPILVDPEKNRMFQEFRSNAIAKLKEAELTQDQEIEQDKTESYPNAAKLIAEYLSGTTTDIVGLPEEDKELLDRMRPYYVQAKTANPDQPVAFQFSNPDDNDRYNKLLARLSETPQLPQEQADTSNLYSEFKVKNGETDEGAFWYEFGNKAAKQLKEAGQFVWGKERIYFDIPLDQMVNMRDLSFKIAQENNIPIAFKYIDLDKTTPAQMDGNETRFVANFASTEDAHRFFDAISREQGYLAVQSDRGLDYNGLNLDGKAHYASGYRERRAPLENIVKTATQNPDGTYTYSTLSSGKKITISAEQYGDFVLEFNNSNPQIAWQEAGLKINNNQS